MVNWRSEVLSSLSRHGEGEHRFLLLSRHVLLVRCDTGDLVSDPAGQQEQGTAGHDCKQNEEDDGFYGPERTQHR